MVDVVTRTRKLPFWYGWVILATIFLVMASIIGARNSLGFFFKEMVSEFGWNRAQISAAYSIGMIAQGAMSPLAGWLCERLSLRLTISLGVLLSGFALLIGSSISSLWQLYLMYALISVGFAAATFVPQVQILSNWFVKRRGLAMGVSTAAQGFAPILNLAIPPLIYLLGWRNSYLVLAGFLLFTTFPISSILLRNDPKETNTVPDAPFISANDDLLGTSEIEILVDTNEELPLSSIWKKIFSQRFLLLGIIYASIALVFTGTVVHIVPHATDQGFTLAASATIFLIWGIGIICANLTSSVSDRIGRTLTYLLGTTFGVAASLLLAFFVKGMHPLLFYIGASFSGIALGLTRPTASSLTADHFSRPGFGKLNGAIMVVFSIFGAIGSWATGFLFDHSCSYWSSFILMAVVYLIGATAAMKLGKVKTPM